MNKLNLEEGGFDPSIHRLLGFGPRTLPLRHSDCVTGFIITITSKKFEC